MRLAEYESSLCSCGCGQPIALAYDKTQGFLVDSMVCQAGRAIEKVRADEAAEAKARKDDNYARGRHYFATPLEKKPRPAPRKRPTRAPKPKEA